MGNIGNWKKRNANVTDVASYVYELTGMTVDQLNAEKEYPEPILDKAKEMILEAVNEGKKICIVGDYDADGITSLSILALCMMKLGASYSMIVPKRLSEGYGISRSILARIPDNCLLITVDNGIAAIEQIKEAKDRGMEVLILDHHKAGDSLPCADLIMDPKAVADGWAFTEYCGAGIGRIMMETVLEEARKYGYEQAELEVIAGNKPAIALYESLGFRKYGGFPDNMKYADGTYTDAWWMMKKL